MKTKAAKYKDAGVDIDLAEGLLASLAPTIKKTNRGEVISSSRSFGGLFQLDLSRYRQPVLVSSIDGVGTKLLVANMVNSYGSIGYDLVNHCVNDVICQGAEPLYFLDYLGIGKLRNPLFEELLTGLAEACQLQSVTLLGGETAEMPGMYGDDYDLVGAITGVVEKSQLITGEKAEVGNTIIGLGSNGLHTNGYSLARKVLFEKCAYTPNKKLPNLNATLSEVLLRPHICYWPAVKKALERQVPIRGIAHITGGGFYSNISRVLPSNTGAVVHPAEMSCPEIFKLIQEKGEISNHEMYKTFNMGIGMVWIVAEDDVDTAVTICKESGFEAAQIGEIVEGNKEVKIHGIDP